MNLHLFDVSQYISAGRDDIFVCRGCHYEQGILTPDEIPVGGLTYLLEEIERFKSPENDLVFCIDKIPTIKREIHSTAFPWLEGYKGHRPKKSESVILQRQMVEEVLRQCGFTVISAYGYEADDCIASLVKYYECSYDKIYIHSKDSDLFYLVSPKVECVPVGFSGKHVTLHNWEKTVLTGYTLPYNMLTLHKMYKGESGDNIPNAPKNIMDKIYDAIPESCFKVCGNNELLADVITEVSNGDKMTMAVMKLIMPLIIDYRDVELYEEELRQDVYNYYLEEFKCKKVNTQLDPERNRVGNDTILKYIDIYSRR